MTRDYFQDLSSDAEGIEPERDAATVPIRQMQQETKEIVESDLPAQPQRSIRNIAPSSRPRMSRLGALEATNTGPTRGGRNPAGNGKSLKRRGLMLWALGLIALLGFGFAVSSIFRKTTVTVVPREHTIVFDEQVGYIAYPENAASAPTGALTYTTESTSFVDSISVTASGTEQVSDAASGTIVVYNSYSDAGVRLIKNTRFETPQGQVFRIRDSIIVPARTAKAPGSITATVYADQPGPSYNVGPIERFSVPGLKDTPDMYVGVYARSTAAMTGGFVGTRPAVSKASREAAEATLVTNLKAKIAAAYADRSVGYTLADMANVTYSALVIETNADGALSGKVTAQATVPVISRVSMDAFLANETSASVENSIVVIADPASFSIQSANTGKVPVLSTDSLDFTLSGSAVFVWQVDAEKLVGDLAGKNKAAFEAIVGGYPSIDSAKAKVYPLWSQTFPTDPKGIKVSVSRAGQE